MTTWTIAQNNHAHGAIAVREQSGVVILTACVGTYPSALSNDGRSTQQVPHILISIQGGTVNGLPYFSGVTVQAISAPNASGQRRYLQVFSEVHYDESHRDAAPDAWIAVAEMNVVEVSKQFVVQDVGRGRLVAHECRRFAELPVVGDTIDLQHKGEAATFVVEQARARENVR